MASLASATSGASPSNNSAATIDQLSEELGMQRAILASLLDLPDSVSKEEEIKKVKLEIVKIQRRLADARNQGLSANANMDRNSMSQSLGGGQGSLGPLDQRKRFLEDAHLNVGVSSRGSSKSRRTSPSPGNRPSSSSSRRSWDYDFDAPHLDDLDLVDLTGDDNEAMREILRLQEEAVAAARRRKAAQDRDAELARQLQTRRSPSPAPTAPTASASRLAPSTNNASVARRLPSVPSERPAGPRPNAFSHLGLSSRQTNPSASLTTSNISATANQARSGSVPYIKSEVTSRPLANSYPDASRRSSALGTGPGTNHGRPSATPVIKSEREQRVVSSGPSSTLPQLPQITHYPPGNPEGNTIFNPDSLPSLSMLGIPPSSMSSRPFQPTNPLSGAGTMSATSGYGTSSAPVPNRRLPPPTFGVSGWPTAPGSQTMGGSPSPASQLAQGSNRPGYVTNGTYIPYSNPYSSFASFRNATPSPSLSNPAPKISGPPGPSGTSSTSGLSSLISKVNGYDFGNMLDQNGEPFGDRLRNFMLDLEDDNVDTKEEIKKLLSNIRPDEDVPEQERGETPEAMKFPLYPHQQLAVKWMSEMEEGTNKGGILADEMGLGKTISTLALMVARPASTGVKTNLIIGPVALIKQWEMEVKNKVKATHELSAFLLHSKRKPYSELKQYDVVLTTYGLLAAEWRRYTKHVEQRKEASGYREEDDQELLRLCPLIHPRSKFYRIILDEAQCINNKDTQAAKAAHQINATYRWCLTGTPMMNGVSELYSLIRFLRIKPYNNFTQFQKDFRCLTPRSNVTNSTTRQNAIRKLQAVLKAMMLRRTKTSTIDGKPILTLPPKTEHSDHVPFSDEEWNFYRALESRSRVMFNKYVRAGTVGKNYSSILVLLLRLRQACCHPHLTEFDATAGDTASDENMMELASSLDRAVVDRIKAIEAFECPICYDGVEDPLLTFPCGHDICTECFASLTETNNQRGFADDGPALAKCPVCRGPVDPGKVITLTAFRKIHAPELLKSDGAAAGGQDDSESDDYSTDDESEYEIEGEESDADKDGNLAGFVMPDDIGDDDALDDNARAPEKKCSKKEKKDKKKKKKDRKSKPVTPSELKHLRSEADKNKEARRRYMRYLRDNWQDSSKVTQVINLLREVRDETDEKAIVFSQWTGLLDLIECQIKEQLPGLHYCRYTGKMSRAQRDEAIRLFTSDPRARVLLVSLRAGNSGLNLTAASRVIVCDPSWNPFIEAQAVDRAHRIGQRREVKVHRLLVEGTVEDRILALQESKRGLVEAALDEGGARSVGRLSERELAYLFGVGPAPVGGAGAGARR